MLYKSGIGWIPPLPQAFIEIIHLKKLFAINPDGIVSVVSKA
jgi:hypothetical protein